MKKYINRIKTLYWFWKMTRNWCDENWIIERGAHGNGKKWLEIWNPREYLTINRREHSK